MRTWQANAFWAVMVVAITALVLAAPVSAIGESTVDYTTINSEITDSISITVPASQSWSLNRGINQKNLGNVVVNATNGWQITATTNASGVNTGKFNFGATYFGKSIKVQERYGYNPVSGQPYTVEQYINETYSPMVATGSATTSTAVPINVLQEVLTTDPSGASIVLVFTAGVI